MLSLAFLSLLACPDPKPDDSGDTSVEADADTDADTDTDTDADSDSDTDTDVVEDCGTTLATGEDLCLAEGDGDGLVIRGLVLGSDRQYIGGSVRIEDGEITCVGCDCPAEDAVVLDCADGVVSPGLINLHDHIGYTEGAPIEHGDTRWDHRHGWRGSLSTPQNSGNAGKAWGEVRMVVGGATSMIGSGYHDGMVRNLDRSSANEGLGLEEIENQTFPLGDSNETFRSDCSWNYKDSESSVYGETAYLPHISEGVDDYAAEEFRCSSSNFDGGEDFLQAHVAYVHAIGLRTEDIYNMSREQTDVIWSPRSNISLYGHTADVLTMDRVGVNLALGTDWTYSGSINMVRELACADQLNSAQYDHYFTDRQLWEMATANPARAVQADGFIGSLTTGLVADIAVFDGSEHPGYRAIIEADSAGVALVLRGGEPMYGDAALMDTLGADCDAMDVCGADKAICADREFGIGYDALEASMSSAYPATFCDDVPTDEPTCAPSRPGEFPLADDDADGDGLADADDNCPSVFNPVRPMDDDVQADHDGDGLGDPCDDTPLLADIDGDTVANADDNCPFDSNTEQADDDNDGAGDVCDFCPTASNPDDAICPAETASVYNIQNGTISEGADVHVEGLVVTGLSGVGFAAQDPDGGEYSGLYVYTSSDPGVSVGDLVTVDGTVTEYFEETEIVASSWTVSGTGTVTAEALTATEAADEAWEGVLVTVSGSVTDSSYDCVVDGENCADAELWEIDSAVLCYDKYYSDSDWTDNIGTTPVTGVMGFRYERRRLMPRISSDF